MYLTKELIPEEVYKLIRTLQTDASAYLVGGCVRDLIMEKTPHDYDICTSLKPDEIINTLKINNINYYESGIKHGTITAIINGNNYEITTYRLESTYSDGRHPDEVYFIDDIEKDLLRRDFTINAMAYDPIANIIIDPYGGIGDIHNGIIKCVGNADDRFNEDALRIMRGLRFAVKFDFEIEDATKKAMLENCSKLNDISKERITDELKKTFDTNKRISKVFIEYSKIIFTLIPELEPTYKFEQKNKYHKHDVYEHCLAVCDGCKNSSSIVRLAALLHDVGKPSTFEWNEEKQNASFHGHPQVSKEITEEICKKDLKLSNKEKEYLLNLIELHDWELPQRQGRFNYFINTYGDNFFMDLMEIKKADFEDHIIPKGIESWLHEDQIMEMYNVYKNTGKDLDLAVTGKDIMQHLQIKPGKEVGKCIELLKNAVTDELVDNNKESLLKYLSEER